MTPSSKCLAAFHRSCAVWRFIQSSGVASKASGRSSPKKRVATLQLAC